MRNRILFILSVLSVLMFSSCSTQNLFTNSKSAHKDTIAPTTQELAEHVIQPDDKITVSIWNHDDLSVGSLYGIYNSNEVYGKWVMIDKLGDVNLPEIGKTKLGGLTRFQAEHMLTELYSKYITNPVVTVKILNIEVTVIGEVFHPGNYVLDKEKNTVVELLGRAGGLDFYANKKKIQIIRGAGAEAHKITIDMTSMMDYKQQTINLQAGDVLYVPTRRSKMIDKKAPVIIPFVSLITGVVVLLKFLGQ